MTERLQTALETVRRDANNIPIWQSALQTALGVLAHIFALIPPVVAGFTGFIWPAALGAIGVGICLLSLVMFQYFTRPECKKLSLLQGIAVYWPGILWSAGFIISGILVAVFPASWALLVLSLATVVSLPAEQLIEGILIARSLAGFRKTDLEVSNPEPQRALQKVQITIFPDLTNASSSQFAMYLPLLVTLYILALLYPVLTAFSGLIWPAAVGAVGVGVYMLIIVVFAYFTQPACKKLSLLEAIRALWPGILLGTGFIISGILVAVFPASWAVVTLSFATVVSILALELIEFARLKLSAAGLPQKDIEPAKPEPQHAQQEAPTTSPAHAFTSPEERPQTGPEVPLNAPDQNQEMQNTPFTPRSSTPLCQRPCRV